MRYLTLILLFCLAFASTPSIARQRTVSNNPNIPAQFSDLQAAIDGSNAGDTLLLAGSNTSYGAVTLAKKLTLIGNAAVSNGSTLNTYADNITLDSTSATTQADNSHLVGIQVGGYVVINGGVSDILIERCYGNGVYLYGYPTGASYNRNIVIRNNAFSNVIAVYSNAGSNPTPGLLVTNNYITQQLSINGALVSNNLFSTGLGNVFSCIVTNNIFWGGQGPIAADNSTMTNNLTYQTANNTLPYGTNSGGNNKINVDPKFISVVTVGSYSTDDDYGLQAGSPAKNAGTDGKDIGPTGGTYPMSNLLVKQAPTPKITLLNVLNGQVSSTGTLNVQVKAKKRD